MEEVPYGVQGIKGFGLALFLPQYYYLIFLNIYFSEYFISNIYSAYNTFFILK